MGVPLLVPLGWFTFSVVGLALAPAGTKRWLAPLALVAWDVGLDPLMVTQGFWAFESGVYYGVPLSNFVGWFLAGMALVTVLGWLEPRLLRDTSGEMRAVFWAQAFLISVGLLFYGLPWAALSAAARICQLECIVCVAAVCGRTHRGGVHSVLCRAVCSQLAVPSTL